MRCSYVRVLWSPQKCSHPFFNYLCGVRLYFHLLFRGFMLYLCYLYSFTYTGVQHDFHIIWCSCRLTVTRQVSHLEHELLTLQEHPSSPPVLSGVRVAQSVVFCRSLFVPLSFFFRSLHCLSCDLRIQNTTLVSSIFS